MRNDEPNDVSLSGAKVPSMLLRFEEMGSTMTLAGSLASLGMTSCALVTI